MKAPATDDGYDKSLGRPVVEGFFLACQPNVADEFIDLSNRNPDVKAYFESKHIVLKDAKKLIDTSRQN